MRKRLTIVGSTLRPQSVESKARIAAALEETVWPLIEQGWCGRSSTPGFRSTRRRRPTPAWRQASTSAKSFCSARKGKAR